MTISDYTRIPNWYFDCVFPYLTSSEIAVLLIIFRYTLGWQRKEDRIALSVFTKSLKISKNTVTTVLQTLCRYRIITIIGNINHPKGRLIRLTMDETIMNWKKPSRQPSTLPKIVTPNSPKIWESKQGNSPKICDGTLPKFGNIKEKKERSYNRGEDLIVVSRLATAAFNIHQKFFPKNPLSQIQIQYLEEITDMETWRRVCSIWKGNSKYNPENIGNMIDRYKNELSHTRNGNGKEQQPQTPERKKIVRDQIPIDPLEIAKEVEQYRKEHPDIVQQLQNIS